MPIPSRDFRSVLGLPGRRPANPSCHTAFVAGLGGLLLFTFSLSASAQVRSQAVRPVDSVRSMPTFAQVSGSGTQTQITLDWSALGGAAAADSRMPLQELQQLQMRDSRPVSDAPVRERSPQVGPDDIVVVALDSQGLEVSWQRVKDPRILRNEMPDANGLLSGETLFRTDSQLVVTVPDDVDAAFLDVYEPVTNGSNLDLRPVAHVPLR